MIGFGKNNKENEGLDQKRYVIDEKTSPFMVTEAFHQLMTNVSFVIPKKEDGTGKVVCITSSMPTEGKSTVSVNLALTIARSGVKTVLLDCDLRKPCVKRFFNIKEKDSKGIVSYLSGQAELKEVLVKDEASGLDILPCIDVAPNPIFLLNHSMFAELLKQLADEYDYIIVDTPPIGIVSDATIIGKNCDGVVCVVRQMYSDHKIVKENLKQLEFAGCRFLGFVLNGFTVSKKKYYYSSDKGYKYGE